MKPYRWPSGEEWATWPQTRRRTEALRLLTEAVRRQLGRTDSPSAPVPRALDLATDALKGRRHSRVEAVDGLYEISEATDPLRDQLLLLHDLAYGQARTGEPAVTHDFSDSTGDIAITRGAAKGKLKWAARKVRKARSLLEEVARDVDRYLDLGDIPPSKPSRSALDEGEYEETLKAQHRRRIRGEEAV